MGFFGNVKDVFKPVTGALKQPPPDPAAALLAQIQASVGSAPSSSELYQDAMNQVSGAYNAQLGNLSEQEKQAKQRQAQGDAQLAAMYAALQKDIHKNAGDIKGNFNSGIASSKKLTGDTVGAINNQYKQTNSELGALFSQLGIQAAAPDALAQGNSDRNFMTSMANVNGQSDVNALNRDMAAGLAFNTAQENIAGLTGKEKRSALLTQLNDALAGIGQQRNTVYGQMSDAVNQRQYQLEQDAISRQNQLNELMMSIYSDQGGRSAGGGAQGDLTASQEYSQMGPVERGYYKASQLFGGEDAGYVMQILNKVATYQNQGTYPNVGHYIRSVLAENEKMAQNGNPHLDPEELELMASYFYDEGGVGTKPQNQF